MLVHIGTETVLGARHGDVAGNLIGIIPGFVSPTQVIYVPVGCALIAFLYYNWMGLKKQGVGKYLAHFAGPIPAMAPASTHHLLA